MKMLKSFVHRLAIIEIFSAALIVALSMFTKAKVAELFVCGATYVSYPVHRIKLNIWVPTNRERRHVAVLVVFVSENAPKL